MNIIIGITGLPGSGKSIAAEYLESKGFVYLSVRKYIVDELLRRGLPCDRPHMIKIGNELRERYGGDYFIQKIFADAQGHDGGVVIESMRTLDGCNALRKIGGVLLALEAPEQLRYERIYARQSETDRISFEEFQEMNAREMYSDDARHQNMSQVIASADYTITNDGNLSDLHTCLDDYIVSVFSQ